MKRERKRCPRDHYRTKPTKGRGIRMCSCGRGWIRVAMPDRKRRPVSTPDSPRIGRTRRKKRRSGPLPNPIRKPLTRYQCRWCRKVVTWLGSPTTITVQPYGRVARSFKLCPSCVEFWADDNGFSLLTR